MFAHILSIGIHIFDLTVAQTLTYIRSRAFAFRTALSPDLNVAKRAVTPRRPIALAEHVLQPSKIVKRKHQQCYSHPTSPPLHAMPKDTSSKALVIRIPGRPPNGSGGRSNPAKSTTRQRAPTTGDEMDVDGGHHTHGMAADLTRRFFCRAKRRTLPGLPRLRRRKGVLLLLRRLGRGEVPCLQRLRCIRL